MTPRIEDAVLSTNLDCQEFSILNPGRLRPVPESLVDINDPRMSDPRPVINGSVINESIAVVAEIDQFKLNFNGNTPTAWLGTGANQAARGDLVQRLSVKGSNSGYAPLDAAGLIPAANITPGVGLGSVNSVGIAMPVELTVSGSPVTGDDTIASIWADAPPGSWLGVDPAVSDKPSFLTGEIPVDLVPNLDGSKFTSGVFAPETLSLAVGMGLDASAGAVPDPGEEWEGDPTDYLGRDMQWHAMHADIPYQPQCAGVQITRNFKEGTKFNVTIRAMQVGSVLMYRINNANWKEVHPVAPDIDENSIDLLLNLNDLVWAYSARAGYNNSRTPEGNILTYRVREVR
jgi:hypothetical protein